MYQTNQPLPESGTPTRPGSTNPSLKRTIASQLLAVYRIDVSRQQLDQFVTQYNNWKMPLIQRWRSIYAQPAELEKLAEFIYKTKTISLRHESTRR